MSAPPSYDCVHCGDEGVLQIVSEGNEYEGHLVWTDVKRMTWCHACEAGKLWREVGLDE